MRAGRIFAGLSLPPDCQDRPATDHVPEIKWDGNVRDGVGVGGSRAVDDRTGPLSAQAL